MKAAGLAEHYANHDNALFYQNAAGVPLLQHIFKQRVTLLLIFMRILLQKKKQGLRTNGLLILVMIQI